MTDTVPPGSSYILAYGFLQALFLHIVIAAHQQLTRRWWRGRHQYRVVVSQVVLDEAAGGDPTERARLLRALRGLPVLPLTDAATKLAGELVRRGALPHKATVDALHIAITAAHEVEFLLTWDGDLHEDGKDTLRAAELQRVERIVIEREQLLLKAWDEYFTITE